MQFIKTLWNKWKKIAHRIGIFQSKAILTVFYFTVFLPAGIVFSLFKDVLGIKHVSSSGWVTKTKQTETLEEMRKQY